MAEKRLKETVKVRVHPVKKERLKSYCEERGVTVQALMENYIDSLIDLSDDELRLFADGRIKEVRDMKIETK